MTHKLNNRRLGAARQMQGSHPTGVGRPTEPRAAIYQVETWHVDDGVASHGSEKSHRTALVGSLRPTPDLPFVRDAETIEDHGE
jgi:hypothetical protein